MEEKDRKKEYQKKYNKEVKIMNFIIDNRIKTDNELFNEIVDLYNENDKLREIQRQLRLEIENIANTNHEMLKLIQNRLYLVGMPYHRNGICEFPLRFEIKEENIEYDNIECIKELKEKFIANDECHYENFNKINKLIKLAKEKIKKKISESNI